MRTKYFVVLVAYDGQGGASLLNEIVVRDKPIQEYADVAKLEKDLGDSLAGGRHTVLLNFVQLGQEETRPTPPPRPFETTSVRPRPR
jgi:hypothetical protein